MIANTSVLWMFLSKQLRKPHTRDIFQLSWLLFCHWMCCWISNKSGRLEKRKTTFYVDNIWVAKNIPSVLVFAWWEFMCTQKKEEKLCAFNFRHQQVVVYFTISWCSSSLFILVSTFLMKSLISVLEISVVKRTQPDMYHILIRCRRSFLAFWVKINYILMITFCQQKKNGRKFHLAFDGMCEHEIYAVRH